MKGLELICFKIIASAGMARSNFIEAMQWARKLDFEKAKQLIKDGEKEFNNAHKAHAELIQSEANGEKIDISLLLVHAQDQMNSAEMFKVIVEEHIELIKLLKDQNDA